MHQQRGYTTMTNNKVKLTVSEERISDPDLIWLSDIHLDHLKYNPDARFEFYEEIKQVNCKRIIITGDIANGSPTDEGDPHFWHYLLEMNKYLNNKNSKDLFYIDFVLGNHDFWGNSIANIRHINASRLPFNIVWSSHCGILPWVGWVVNTKANIVGFDGWYDCRYGVVNSTAGLSMNDWRYIEEFDTTPDSPNGELAIKFTKDMCPVDALQAFADKEVANFTAKLIEFENKLVVPTNNYIILTHVPPFPENAKHDGRISRETKLPFYASKVSGDMLLQLADNNPDKNYFVFCGHSHAFAYHSPRENLQVWTAAAEYKFPRISGYLKFENVVE